MEAETFDRRTMTRLVDGNAFPRAGYRAPSMRENMAALCFSVVGVAACVGLVLAGWR